MSTASPESLSPAAGFAGQPDPFDFLNGSGWGWDFDLSVGDAEATENAPLPDPGERFLHKLTNSQREAVVANDGPLLVLAGAGTGKTRVLTTRIAWRLEQSDETHAKLLPAHVLALTFTHKAADEMKRRLERVIGATALKMDIGTFHGVFARAIRECYGHAGLSETFTIIDETDQRAMIKDCYERLHGEDAWKAAKETTKPDQIIEAFSRIKMSRLPGQEPFKCDLAIPNIDGLLSAYEKRKKEEDVADYDDILFTFNRALDNERILNYYASKWRFILVDEFQDTNAVQYSILTKLADAGYQNITCVGDNDQSIYSFRQADVRNILEFEERWANSHIVRLEDNFRSTSNILGAANKLIRNNTDRHDKTLLATKNDGAPLNLQPYNDGYDEARHVAMQIGQLLEKGAAPTQIAVITRTAAALVSIEHNLLAAKIPYTIAAGRRVSERMELKVIAAYIRMALNPTDETAFVYAFESRKRSVGKVGLSKLRDIARRADTSIEEVMRQEVATTDPKKHNGARYLGLKEFLEGIDDLRALIQIESPVRDIVEAIINVSDIGATIDEAAEKGAQSDFRDEQDKAKKLAAARRHNIEEILEQAGQAETLVDLSTNIVLSNEKIAEDKAIWLGTIHAAKGLEFDHVFLPAFENGILPSPMASDDPASYDYQEERNLAYVAITRAKETLTVSYANQRNIFGQLRDAGPSPFLSEF